MSRTYRNVNASKRPAPPEIVREYAQLSHTMLESVYRVDFPFGIVAGVRRRMDAIESRYELPEVAS